MYNGERYLEESIDSILAQTFTDFELVISDNASTDRTEAICRRYEESDSRVRYHRNAENIGGANNHNLTFELARGDLFRWASYDDVCAPELLERCVAVLDDDPAVTLCYSAVASIDEHGERIEVISRNNADGRRPHQRFAGVAGSRDYCEETYGIIRSEVFGSTRLQQNYTGSDRTLLSETRAARSHSTRFPRSCSSSGCTRRTATSTGERGSPGSTRLRKVGSCSPSGRSVSTISARSAVCRSRWPTKPSAICSWPAGS